jgi:hypothetical protein
LGQLASVFAAIGVGTLKGIGDALPPLGQSIKSFLDALASATKGDFSKMIADIGNAVGHLGEGLIKIPLGIAEEVGKLFGIDVKGGMDAWKGNFDNLGVIIGGLFGPEGKITKALQDFDLKAEIERVVGGAIDWLKGAGTTLWESTFGALGKAASAKLAQVGEGIVASVKTALRRVLAAVLALDGAGVPGLEGVINALVGAVGKRSGGPVTGGTPYIVGEAGREMFVPSTSGRIVPNGALGSGGGGGNISIQNVTVYGVQNVEEMYAQIRAKAKSMNRPLAGAM